MSYITAEVMEHETISHETMAEITALSTLQQGLLLPRNSAASSLNGP
jgi:hypothetical protein